MERDIDIPQKIFAARLNEAMEYRNINQAELHKKSGVSKSQLSRFMNGSHKGNVAAAILFDIAEALQCSAKWLIGRTDDPGYYEPGQGIRFAVNNEEIHIDEGMIYRILLQRKKEELKERGQYDTESAARLRLQEKLDNTPGDQITEFEHFVDYLSAKKSQGNENTHNP